MNKDTIAFLVIAGAALVAVYLARGGGIAAANAAPQPSPPTPTSTRDRIEDAAVNAGLRIVEGLVDRYSGRDDYDAASVDVAALAV